MKLALGIIAIAILIGISFLLSSNRKKISWRAVGIGLLIQTLIVLFVLKVPIGRRILEGIANGFSKVFELGMEGVNFVFGGLSTTGFVFAINSLSLIVFTSAIISVLYFFKVIPFLVKYLGGAIAKVLGTSPVESMCCVSNMMLGGSEAILVVGKYLPKISNSELFVCMASGFASASVGILAGYVGMGFDLSYMLIAVFTVPFSTIMIAKIIVPQAEEVNVEEEIEITGESYENIFEAITTGSLTGMQVALAIGATLIGFLGVVAIINYFLSLLGTSLSQILGLIFMPLGWLLSIPTGEISTFGQVLGYKVGVNEFVAFDSMAKAVELGALSSRTVAILTTACTNFANFASIGIVSSAMITLAPSRKSEVMKFGLKALVVGTIAAMVTASLVAIML
ncbi:MAG: nucleoside transporter C-terminal domain-containing protein [Clostridium sp.]|uniref:NupC/NupG family nucleoside CNT transporter n=1 Tax=Clostridium sp. TaxID=1506 RepID=UPI0030236160